MQHINLFLYPFCRLLPMLAEAVVAGSRIAVRGGVDGTLPKWAAVTGGGNAPAAALAQPHRFRNGRRCVYVRFGGF